MKKTTLKLVILMFLTGFQQFASAQNNIIDEVIWVVGEEAILRSDVENQKLQMQYQNEKIDGDPNCVIPEQIAIQKLYLHQAKLDSVCDLRLAALATAGEHPVVTQFVEIL
jgi:peptidyl-prolyl cis-trans isomerase SurA